MEEKHIWWQRLQRGTLVKEASNDGKPSRGELTKCDEELEWAASKRIDHGVLLMRWRTNVGKPSTNW